MSSWKALWERNWTGDTSAKWFNVMRHAIASHVPDPSDVAFSQDKE